jgi:hypothetical protein
MRSRSRYLAWLLGAAVIVLPTAAPAQCPPLPGGTDSFPSTVKLVIDDAGFGEPFVVRLSSASHPDAVVQRAPQVGDTIDTELIQLELAGFQPRVGSIILRQDPAQPSLGQIRNVTLDEDGACGLVSGDSFFDVFVEIELPDQGQTWIHEDPIRIEAPLDGLPPRDARYEVPVVEAIVMRDKDTDEERGQLFYALHHADSPFPEPGLDCSDGLLTADLNLFGPGSTANLIGFGPMTVRRGATIPGGYCSFGGNPCATDDDCSGLDTCVRDRLETEIVVLDLAGFDPLLGGWQTSVRPEAGTSNCCVAHAGGGCSDPVCEDLICGLDSFCCTEEWDSLCANLAASEPLCADNCLDPDAAPSWGTVRSVQPDRTYPAASEFDLFLRLDSDSQGSLHNDPEIPVQPVEAVTNVPPDPNTEHVYSGPPVPMLDETDSAVGEISNLVLTSQIPKDCSPPPPTGEECFDAGLQLELVISPCPAEIVWAEGPSRVLRDDPRDPIGLGQEVIDRVTATGRFTGLGPCTGTVVLRVSSSLASSGPVSSLAPEEFFPAESFFDVHFELDVGTETLTADPLRLATSVDVLPLDPGEIHFGPDSVVNLRNGGGAVVGAILAVTHEVLSPVACPADSRSAIVFAGPSRDDFDVSIPGGGDGVDYDVVRGDLASLVANGGSFSSAACLASDVGPQITDTDVPTSGAGFYYVARDGFGAFNGSWNGPGPAQQGDRDAKLPSCP